MFLSVLKVMYCDYGIWHIISLAVTYKKNIVASFLHIHRYRWISYINPNYYGFSASAFLLLNDFKTDCTGTPFECFTSSGEYVLGQFSFEKINPYVNISVRHFSYWTGAIL